MAIISEEVEAIQALTNTDLPPLEFAPSQFIRWCLLPQKGAGGRAITFRRLDWAPNDLVEASRWSGVRKTRAWQAGSLCTRVFTSTTPCPPATMLMKASISFSRGACLTFFCLLCTCAPTGSHILCRRIYTPTAARLARAEYRLYCVMAVAPLREYWSVNRFYTLVLVATALSITCSSICTKFKCQVHLLLRQKAALKSSRILLFRPSFFCLAKQLAAIEPRFEQDVSTQNDEEESRVEKIIEKQLENPANQGHDSQKDRKSAHADLIHVASQVQPSMINPTPIDQ